MLDYDAWLKQAREDSLRLCEEDLSSEPDAW